MSKANEAGKAELDHAKYLLGDNVGHAVAEWEKTLTEGARSRLSANDFASLVQHIVEEAAPHVARGLLGAVRNERERVAHEQEQE